MTRMTPELVLPSPSFHATRTEGRLAATYNLACNKPHTRRIFSGIGFRAWNSLVPRLRPCHWTTAASCMFRVYTTMVIILKRDLIFLASRVNMAALLALDFREKQRKSKVSGVYFK
ncbi:hypothetical protein AVEN_156117-1 [Araneus ventricosus]|uniref:Uncharacterized protein n=1 Tax=Araneus ventricosus TaxID=182803 RepID=A0A4Y2S7K6_ARAVE|nr:hypothetical protein AVEN_156117-1 [Araneus ventricosus]